MKITQQNNNRSATQDNEDADVVIVDHMLHSPHI
jgi:hypothetical protein